MNIYVAISLLVLLVGCGSYGYAAPVVNTTKPVISAPAKPVETKEQYIASTKKIGLQKDPIYIKYFINNPDKYKDVRVKIRVKVTEISKKDNQTMMKVALTTDYDPGIVLHQGPVKVRGGDIIEVYGEVSGSSEGYTRKGAAMHWPTIVAKYVKKVRSSDDDN